MSRRDINETDFTKFDRRLNLGFKAAGVLLSLSALTGFAFEAKAIYDTETHQSTEAVNDNNTAFAFWGGDLAGAIGGGVLLFAGATVTDIIHARRNTAEQATSDPLIEE